MKGELPIHNFFFLKYSSPSLASSQEEVQFSGKRFLNPAGSNYCYINATLNGLFSCQPFYEVVKDSTSQVGSLLNVLFLSESVGNVESLKAMVASINEDFATNQQQDSQEFLMNLLSLMPLVETVTSVEIATLSVCQLCQAFAEGSYTNNQVQFGLRADTSLSALLDSFSDTEDFVRKCNSCGEQGMHTKSETVIQAPKLLIVHAKRYTEDSLQVCVFPTMRVRFGGTTFSLRSVVQHEGGSLMSGHYVAYIPFQDDWILCDDSRLSTVSSVPMRGYIFFLVSEKENCHGFSKLPSRPEEMSKPGKRRILVDPLQHSTQNVDLAKTTANRDRKRKSSSEDQSLKSQRIGKLAKKTFVGPEKNGHMEEPTVMREQLKQSRMLHQQSLRDGESRFDSLLANSPIILAGMKIHKELAEMDFGPRCKICHERWFGVTVGPRTGCCRRCARERSNPFPTFSKQNLMVPSAVPECLSQLTLIEECSIRLIAPILYIYRRQGGSTGLRGKCHLLRAGCWWVCRGSNCPPKEARSFVHRHYRVQKFQSHQKVQGQLHPNPQSSGILEGK